MTRRLGLKKEVLNELTTEELGSVAGGAVSLFGWCIDVSVRTECGIPTCGYTCTNTSTVFKG